MPHEFFIVGPTAVGKSSLAMHVAEECGAEIVNADAFQLYRGIAILTAQPEAEFHRRVPHRLFGVVDVGEDMSALKFRERAMPALLDIRRRGKPAVVVSGSGLYVKALTHGFDIAVPPNAALREELDALSLPELVRRLRSLDPERAARTDCKNRRRVVRAVEIASVIPSAAEAATQATQSARLGFQCRRATSNVPQRDPSAALRSARDDGLNARGVFVLRRRDDLYARINARVRAMFEQGVVEEVAALENVGPTAAQALGLREIRQLIAGEISREECIGRIQQATRRYARRQLTWFRHQTTFPQLNLSDLSHREAISAMMRMFAQG